MASKNNMGCAGVAVLLVLGMALISVIVFLLGVAAAVAALAGAGWLIYSASGDLRRRSRLGKGTDELQVTGMRSLEVASASHEAAREALESTLSSWHHLTLTRGIGSPYQETYDQVEVRVRNDPGFQDLLQRAEHAHTEAVISRPETAAELTRQTVELDRLNARIRTSVHWLGGGPGGPLGPRGGGGPGRIVNL